MFKYAKYQINQKIITVEELRNMLYKSVYEFECLKQQKKIFKVNDIELKVDNDSVHKEIYSDNLGIKLSFKVIILIFSFMFI